MKRKIEGLILKKTPYQDRHLVIQLLLRSGKKVSVIFHGGQGGGSKKKDTVLELGHMLAVELRVTKTNSDLYNAKEWRTLWVHNKIRLEHRKFYLMCFILELGYKVSLDDNLHDKFRESDESHLGIFKVLSNALFQLEKSISPIEIQGNIFLTKLFIELGVFPDVNRCVVSGEKIEEGGVVILLSEQGGFGLAHFLNNDQYIKGQNDNNLRVMMKDIAALKYNEIDSATFDSTNYINFLTNYLSYHFQFDLSGIKSLKLLF